MDRTTRLTKPLKPAGAMARRRLRTLAPPFVVAAPSGARIRDRVRLSGDDERVLRAVGEHLGSLAGRDLAARCRAGAAPKHADRAVRKRALTAASSSRWAGTITRVTADQWERGRHNLWDERTQLRAAIRTIGQRLAAPVAGKAGRVTGYRTRAERWHKQERRQVLEARLTGVEADIAAGRVSIVRGGSRLVKTRHNLDAAGLSEHEWRHRWDAARLFLTADGEADKRWGNETIRVNPDDGTVEIRLPTPLAHLSNTAGRAPTYRLGSQVGFHHRADEWAAQAATGAVAYTIWFDPERARWYLDASWTGTPSPVAGLDELRRQPTLGVDLNADHLAAWIITPDGNPIGPPHTIPLDLSGPRATRDGRLRAAISRLLDIAASNGCASVTIENLGFVDARHTGRETMGRGRRGRQFRRTVAGIPTSQFRTRLAGMAANRGIAVIAVDPAYTSRWGSEHWQQTLDQSHTKTSGPVVTRHQAAAVVIGRRGHGHKARRRTEKTVRHQRMPNGEPSSRPNPNPVTVTNPTPTRAPRTGPNRTRQACPNGTRQGTRRPNTVRSRPPHRTHSCTVSRNGRTLNDWVCSPVLAPP